MFDFLKSRTPSAGAALFPGTIPAPLESFDSLGELGIEVQPASGDDELLWRATLRHDQWGTAEVASPRQFSAMPLEVLRWDPRLSEEEAQQISRCQSAVFINMAGKPKNVLRDRKNLFYFLDAFLQHDGCAGLDVISKCAWTAEDLKEEASHDADLDVEALFVLHAINEQDGDGSPAEDDEEPPPPTTWLHSHGLAELGYCDYDILLPHASLMDCMSDTTRALAFAIIEGDLKANRARLALMEPDGAISMVDAKTFMARADEQFTSLRYDLDGDHIQDRGVICEPPRRRRWPWQKQVGVVPIRWMQREMPDQYIVRFSDAATKLMALRAKQTYPVLRELFEELEGLQLPTLVKLAYETDSGSGGGCEHLWFEVEALSEDTLDGVLMNQPFDIARLKEGYRSEHSAERISDWQVMTPLGNISPRSLRAARTIRANREYFDAFIQACENA